MAAATNVRDRDLRALADIVNADRHDVPPEGLPPSLLGDLARQIRCDAIAFGRFDSAQQRTDSAQLMADGDQSVAAVPFRSTGSTTGTVGFAATPTEQGILAASSRPRTSTRRGSGMASAVAAASTSQWGSIMP